MQISEIPNISNTKYLKYKCKYTNTWIPIDPAPPDNNIRIHLKYKYKYLKYKYKYLESYITIWNTNIWIQIDPASTLGMIFPDKLPVGGDLDLKVWVWRCFWDRLKDHTLEHRIIHSMKMVQLIKKHWKVLTAMVPCKSTLTIKPARAIDHSSGLRCSGMR